MNFRRPHPVPVRAGRLISLLSILSRMGVEMGAAHDEGRAITVHEIREPGPEPIATLQVRSAPLHGAEIEARPDGFAVLGAGGLRGGTIDARGDHRLAMVGAIAGLASEAGVEVEGFEAVAVSYPRFERDLRALLA